MNINTNYISNNNSYAGQTVDYIVIHNTDNFRVGADAKCHAKAQHDGNFSGYSAHVYVDDNSSYQAMPYDRGAWHVGVNYGGKLFGTVNNRNSIGIEMCVNNGYNYEKAFLNTVDVCKQLMKQYNIPEERVVSHFDVCNKDCPSAIRANGDWKRFKELIRGVTVGGEVTNAVTVTDVLYRVRTTWEDSNSQLGAYRIFDNAKKDCPAGYSVFDPDGKVLYTVAPQGFQATYLNGLTESEKIKKIAPLYQEVMKKTGMLASVGLAQFCLESGYGTTDLAQKANNLHGQKCSLSGNKWEGSTWDGTSMYTKRTSEQRDDGTVYYIEADFRKYKCCEDSIADRAAYLIGAMNGNVKRYPGINRIKNWKEQVELIKAGGYATDVNYVSKLESLITRYNLFQYDDVEVNSDIPAYDILPETEQPWYRVRLKWSDAASQIGAYHDLANAKECVDNNPGYTVFDENGTALYSTANNIPYLVQVTTNKVKIYTGPGIGYATTGATTGIGKFTIVEEKKGKVNSKGTTGTWGRLKSGAGWIRVGTSTVKKVK